MLSIQQIPRWRQCVYVLNIIRNLINREYSILRIGGYQTYACLKIDTLHYGDGLYCESFKLY